MSGTATNEGERRQGKGGRVFVIVRAQGCGYTCDHCVVLASEHSSVCIFQFKYPVGSTREELVKYPYHQRQSAAQMIEPGKAQSLDPGSC